MFNRLSLLHLLERPLNNQLVISNQGPRVIFTSAIMSSLNKIIGKSLSQHGIREQYANACGRWPQSEPLQSQYVPFSLSSWSDTPSLRSCHSISTQSGWCNSSNNRIFRAVIEHSPPTSTLASLFLIHGTLFLAFESLPWLPSRNISHVEEKIRGFPQERGRSCGDCGTIYQGWQLQGSCHGSGWFERVSPLLRSWNKVAVSELNILYRTLKNENASPEAKEMCVL